MEQPANLQWILCDLGKTLVNFDHQKVAMRLLSVIGKQNPGGHANVLSLYAWFFLENSQGIVRNTEIDTGRMTIEDVHREFSQHFNIKIELQEFDRIWHDIFSDTYDNVIEAMHNAQKNGVHVAICSSTNASHWHHVLEKYPAIASITEKAFLTFEMGMMKTDADFFPAILKDLGVEGSDVLFIDDKDENLRSAEVSEIHALKFEGELPDWEIFR